MGPGSIRAAAAAFAPLFEYPGEGYRGELLAARRAVAALCPSAAARLDAFLAETADCDGGSLEELYTRTFDLSPPCAPYLSVHLFGDGSFRRARLMTAFAEAYSRVGFDPEGELPDHLVVVLRFAAGMSEEEWEELVRLCLGPALAAMGDALGRAENPYRHLLLGLEELIGGRAPKGEEGPTDV